MGPGLWSRLAACVVLACAPLALALLTEGLWAGGDARVVFLLAFGLALATGAVLLLRAGDARAAREAAAPERALRQAREQQAATAEILTAMATSPPDLQTVFDTIARNALRLCGGAGCGVFRYDGSMIHLVATHGISGEALEHLRSRYPLPPGDESLAARAVWDRSIVNVADLLTDPDVPPGVRESARLRGVRGQLIVPMLRDGELVGLIGVTRLQPGRFPDAQVTLLQTFAHQAIIAIENVRLFTELETRNQELIGALSRQTATSEILQVISRSPKDTQPVFEAIVKSASSLLGGAWAALTQVRDGALHLVSYHAPGIQDAAVSEWLSTYPRTLDDESLGTVAVRTRQTISVANAQTDPRGSPGRGGGAPAAHAGFRGFAIMPMLRDGQGIGAIHVARLAEGSFTDVELALLRTFADQAVIAIENVRLFQELETRNRELTEGLEREMATADLLRIISSSPTDLAPVFESILDRALVLCSATMGAVGRRDADLVSVVALKGPPEQAKVVHAAYPRRLTDPGYMVRAIRERRTMQVADMLAEPMPIPIPGIRSQLMVPMLKDGEALGAIVVNRPESGLFSPAQVKLLETFADQAVIAIENVRLFTELGARNRELTESLEQQTATAEILRVISQSPTDTRPVFRSIVESAVRLCDGRIGALYRIDDGTIDVMASKMADDEARRAHDASYPRPLADLELPMQRLALEAAPVHLMDVDADPRLSDAFRARARVQGYRTGVLVPTVREGRTIGVISVGRAGAGRTPRPFSEREIALLQTFADQAVIAIENTRLFQELQARNRELTEALEQQTATAEILRVISSSPTDVQPVFDSILERAMRLADAVYGAAFSFDGELIHQVAHRGLSDEALAMARRVYPMAPSSEQLTGVAVLEQRVIHVRDVDTAPEASAMTRQFARTIGFRALLAVPMLREGRPVGVLTLTRAAGEFSARHIELVEMFADQAVIAIENVRLFTELGARNRELSESLEQQTATAEILRAISSSPTDTQPVFDTIAQSAVRLCDGRDCFVWRFDGTLVDIVAHHGFSSDVLNGFRRMYPVPIEADTLSARSIRERAVVHRPDIPNDPDVSEFVRQIARMGGYRTGVVVPMLRSGSPIGAIGVTRGELTAEPRPFSDKEIALLQTFTDQAVIAIENVRLFTELGARNRDLTEALEQQTATSEILRAISSSPTDTQPVFDTIAQRAVRVCDGRQCSVYQLDGALVRFVAHYGLPPEALEAFQRVYPLTLDADTLAVRSIHDGAVVHVPDLVTDLSETSRRFGEAGGFRSAVVVPMLRSGRAVGAIGIGRGGPDGAPRPFTEKEIALLQTFADQGVIAVENVRLFRELETRTRELARSVEELRALSEVGRAVSSTLDLPTVLATIVARAVQLSGTSSGVLYEYDEATQTFHLQASHQTEAEVVEALRASPIQVGEGATGRAVAQRTPVEVVDILDDQQFRTGLRTILTRLGYRSVLSIPFLAEQRILGALTVSRREPGHFPPDTVNLLQTFATQSALAIQNARLFREIEAKGRELEVASRHKSQFLANMSHELRTPLNAILGYTELMVDGIYGDLPQKAGDVMARIDRSGKHLLGLINDVLDLSKIEAGQLELALADYSLAEMVNAVMTQVESLAGEKGLLLQATVAPNLPAGRGDERRLAQVLLNLVGNALKFAEAGAVRIGAYQEGDAFVVSVADTGPGIAEADRQRIFEEFQQADSSSTRKKGGTGLGLSIARRIVELHGGRIWVESTVGRGSTFSFRVPVRVERQAARV